MVWLWFVVCGLRWFRGIGLALAAWVSAWLRFGLPDEEILHGVQVLPSIEPHRQQHLDIMHIAAKTNPLPLPPEARGSRPLALKPQGMKTDLPPPGPGTSPAAGNIEICI